MILARSLCAAGLLASLALAGVGPNDASAQQIYRIVGPDGRVTFSDQPPADGSGTRAKTVPLGRAGAETATFPFQLREAATRYPVTLYSSAECAPCGSARAMLAGRGIPFAERTVGGSSDDIDALKRIAGGATSLPLLTIGGQTLKGYSEIEWNQYLDAAGYPKNSQLPVTYARPRAEPIIAAQDPTQVQQPAPQPRPLAPPPPPVAPPPAADNPNGIQF
jgi:glutaredoxin